MPEHGFRSWFSVRFSYEQRENYFASNRENEFAPWHGIETYNNYVKNDADFNDLKNQDYYCAHGFDFIMLVTGLIHSRLNEAVKSLGKNSISTIDMLIKAGHMRMVKHDDQWKLHNTRTKDIALFESIGFTPSLTYSGSNW